MFRLIAALTVFVNHSLYSGEIPFLALLGRWTVPFFFMVSGYYFQQAFQKLSLKAFTKTVKSLLTVILLANSFYLLFVGFTDGSLESLNSHFTLLVGTYFHLWFLTSLLLGYGVLWIFLVFKLEKFLPFLALGVIILILGLNPYSYLLGLSPHPVYARSFLSIPFLCIGFILAKYALDVYVSMWTACLIIAIGVGMQVVEAWFLSQSWQDAIHYNFLVGTLLFSTGMFLVALKLQIPSDSLLSYYGRRYSLAFYLYHPAVNYLIFKTWIQAGATSYWLSPFLSILILFPLLLILDRISPTFLRMLTGNFQQYTLLKNI